ncbi:AraC family transcriptional regulator [Aquimarina sp. AU474]|uniref:helix-turn-helix domain-containing protein n=1 Tax=Aquimarina sp. AU474 TaxID=2108529 RepID=UPI000D69F70D|nr:helix-turn-helix domain-containing protein [Aquimarina sp. AU474]
MKYEFDLYGISAIIALVQLPILIAYLLIGRKSNTTNWLLILFFCALAFDLFHRIIIDTKIILDIPFFVGSGSISQYIYGPAIYLIILSLTRPNKKWQPLYFLHFVPFLINLFLFLSNKSSEKLSQDLNMLTQFMTDLENDPTLKFGYPINLYSYFRNILFFTLHPVIYLLISIRMLTLIGLDKRKAQASYIPWLKTMIFGFLLILVLGELAYLSVRYFEEYYWFLDSFIIWRPLYVFIILFIALVWPLSHKKLRHIGNEKLTGGFLISLQTYMDVNKSYKNPELSRYDLAKSLQISPGYLTDVLNTELGTNFKEYINGYRVKEVKNLIKKGKLKDLTIDAIGNEAGFSSRSTFFRVFKDVEGITPLSYANRLLEGPKKS